MKSYNDENSRNTGEVTLELSPAEALVFFDWLQRSSDAEAPQMLLPAEQRVLWNIEALLEKALVVPFGADYSQKLKEAREELGE